MLQPSKVYNPHSALADRVVLSGVAGGHVDCHPNLVVTNPSPSGIDGHWVRSNKEEALSLGPGWSGWGSYSILLGSFFPSPLRIGSSGGILFVFCLCPLVLTSYCFFSKTKPHGIHCQVFPQLLSWSAFPLPFIVFLYLFYK